MEQNQQHATPAEQPPVQDQIPAQAPGNPDSASTITPQSSTSEDSRETKPTDLTSGLEHASAAGTVTDHTDDTKAAGHTGADKNGTETYTDVPRKLQEDTPTYTETGTLQETVSPHVSPSLPTTTTAESVSPIPPSPSPSTVPSSPSLALPETLKDTHYLHTRGESVYLLHKSLKGNEIWSGALDLLDKEGQVGFNVKVSSQEQLDLITFNFE